MNELLQKHGCANVFSVPEGLKELMSDITREVLREQPPKICKFIAEYLSVLILTREHGIMAVKIINDLCDCKPSVSEHLLDVGLSKAEVKNIAQIIKEEIESYEPGVNKENLREYQIIKKVLKKIQLDEVKAEKVCQVARNAYRDYWYRKKALEKSFKINAAEPWEIAAERTLAIYKKTKPSFAELTRAAEKIQAAYKGYYVRRNLLRHLKPKPKKKGAKVELPGPPTDISGGRQIDFGPLINFCVKEDDVVSLFGDNVSRKLGLSYDPMTTITHIPDDDADDIKPCDFTKKFSVFPALTGPEGVTPSVLCQKQLPSNKAEPRQTILSSLSPRTGATPPQRISFSRVVSDVILPEEEVLKVEDERREAQEIIELLQTEPEEAMEILEIPEDIAADKNVEYDSAPSSAPASVLSSPPDTARTTDAEDVADFVDSAGEH